VPTSNSVYIFHTIMSFFMIVLQQRTNYSPNAADRCPWTPCIDSMALGMSYGCSFSNDSLGEYVGYITPMLNNIQASTTAFRKFLLNWHCIKINTNSKPAVYTSNFVTMIDMLDPQHIFNYTTQTSPSDGSTPFALISCSEGCTQR